MWKDFFYFSRGQRIAVVTLFVAIFFVVLLSFLLPLFVHPDRVNNDNFDNEVIAFRKTLLDRDSLRKQRWMEAYQRRAEAYARTYPYKKWDHKPQVTYSLFSFDPNLLDSAGFVSLGIRPFIARNIEHYIKAGGKFKSAQDFSKVYGLSSQKYAELEPYIQIAAPPVEEKKEKKRTDLIVDLNTADTSLLMQVKGIGRAYAYAIVHFRQQSGGFVSVDQLADVAGMTAENMERIKVFCRIGEYDIRPIRVNFSNIERMKNHPYLGFYKAKSIYELRRRKGKLTDINELRELPELSEKDIERLRPYLNFQ